MQLRSAENRVGDVKRFWSIFMHKTSHILYRYMVLKTMLSVDFILFIKKYINVKCKKCK